MRNYYVPGDWNAICDRCAFKFKASALRREWTGLRVCNKCFETRHPQTLIRVTPEHVNTEWARPESADIFLSVPSLISTELDVVLYTENQQTLTTEGT